LRSTHEHPVFYIRDDAHYELDEAELPDHDEAFCNALLQAPLDISVSPFRARLYRVRGRAAFLALSVHHVVLDGPSQQLVYGHLTRILDANRSGEEVVISKYSVSRIGQHAISHHLRTLNAQLASGLPPQAYQLKLPFRISHPDRAGAEISSWHLPEKTIEAAKASARGMGVTLNSFLLGTLAVLLHRRSKQERFGIGQTYLGRQRNEMQAVGSFSTNTPMAFDFSSCATLLDVCQHITAETHRVMALDVIVPPDQIAEVCWELNDVRPIPLPDEYKRVACGFSHCSMMFMVNQCADGFQFLIGYVDRLNVDDVEAFARQVMIEWAN